MKRLGMSARFAKFVVVSGIAAMVNIGSRILFNLWMGYTPAILLAFCAGLVTAFFLNRLYVFRDTTNALHQQALWFIVVNLAAVAQTLAISLLLARIAFPRLGWSWHPDTIAHAIGVAAPAISSFFGHRYLTFRITGDHR